MLIELAADDNDSVRAFAAYLLGLHPTDASRIALTNLLKDSDALVKRHACESLVRVGPGERTSYVVLPLLTEPDPWLRWAARKVLERTGRFDWIDAALAKRNARQSIEVLTSTLLISDEVAVANSCLKKAAAVLGQKTSSGEFLDVLRVMEVAVMKTKGAAEATSEIGAAVAGKFPSDDWRINCELARLMIALNAPGANGKILGELKREQLRDEQSGATTQADEVKRNLSREQQIHYAYCLRAAHDGWTIDQKREFAAWFAHAAKWGGGNSFKGYIRYLQQEFEKSLTEQEKLAMQTTPANSVKTLANVPTIARTNKVYTSDELAKFLEEDPSAKRGAVSKGRVVFEAVGCARCHQHGAVGSGGLGPDLSTLASRMKTREILEAIVYPSKIISDQYKQTIVKTKKGDVYSGLAAANSPVKIELAQADGTHVIIPRTDVLSAEPSTVSLMPENLLDGIALTDIADLFAFLQSIAAAR